MNRQINQILMSRWGEYQRLYKEGAIYSALVRLGEIDNYLRYQRPSELIVEEWKVTLRDVDLSEDDIRAAWISAKSNVERLRRMLGVGISFYYEELMAAVTMRVELQLFTDFLATRGLLDKIDTASLDQDLLDLANTKENASVFRKVQAVAKRNWGIPLESPWLGQDKIRLVQR